MRALPNLGERYVIRGCPRPDHHGKVVIVLQRWDDGFSIVQEETVRGSEGFRESNECLIPLSNFRSNRHHAHPVLTDLDHVRLYLGAQLARADYEAHSFPDAWPTVIDILRSAIKRVIDGGAE